MHGRLHTPPSQLEPALLHRRPPFDTDLGWCVATAVGSTANDSVARVHRDTFQLLG